MRDDALAAAGSGSLAIVPGKIDESELYRRITTDDPEERMPPARTGKSLTPAEVGPAEDLDRRRVPSMRGTGRSSRRGRPALPSVKNRAWCRNPIDSFVLARLEAEGSLPRPRPTRLPSSAGSAST